MQGTINETFVLSSIGVVLIFFKIVIFNMQNQFKIGNLKILLKKLVKKGIFLIGNAIIFSDLTISKLQLEYKFER